MGFHYWSLPRRVTPLRRVLLRCRHLAVFRGGKLAHRLTTFTLISLIPLLIAAYWLVDQSVSRAKATILRDSLHVAQSTEFEVRKTIATVTRALTALAEEQSVVYQDGELATRLFKRARSLYPELQNIEATDVSGRIFAAAVWHTKEERSVGDVGFFRRAMQSELPLLSSTRMVSWSTGFPAIALAVPIRDDTGQRIGVVIGELGLQYLHMVTSLATMGDPERRNIVLVDQEGSVLTHPEWRYVAQGTSFAHSPAVKAALQNKRGALETEDPAAGERMLVAYAPVGGTFWAVLVERPVADAYGAVWDIMVHDFLIVILGMLATGVLAFVLFRGVGRSLDVLSSKIRDALDGGAAGSVGGRNIDELQQLSGALDSMVGMLDSRAGQLAELRSEVDQLGLQLRLMPSQIVSAEEQQRKRVAMDLHDTVAQLLATALLEAQAAEQCMASDLETAQHKIRATLELIQEGSRELRCTLFELRAQGVQHGKLVAEVQAYLKRFSTLTGLRCTLDVDGVPFEIEQPVETAIYRVFQECLHNVKKHARATVIRIRLSFDPTAVALVVRDNGRGFGRLDQATALPGHLGLAGMQERAAGVAGSLTIESAPKRGTTVTLVIPKSPALSQAQDRDVAYPSLDLGVPNTA